MTPGPWPSVPAPRSAFASIVLALVIFVGGAAVGGSIAVMVMGERLEKAARHLELLPSRAANRLALKLELDDDQRDVVLKIFEEHIESVLAVRHESTQRMRAQLAQLLEDMTQVLTPDQDARWRELSTQLFERFLPELALEDAHRPTSEDTSGVDGDETKRGR